MKQLIFLLVFVFLVSSCLNMIDPENQARYIESYNSFDKSLVDHMPKKLPNNLTNHSWAPLKHITEYGQYAEISVTLLYPKRKLQEIKESFIKNAKYVGASNDSCFVIVETIGRIANSQHDSIYCNELIPVSQNALYNYESEEVSERKSNIELVVLDFESGIFVDSDKLKPRESMPAGLKNGYSKGLAIDNNKQTIKYWLIIW